MITVSLIHPSSGDELVRASFFGGDAKTSAHFYAEGLLAVLAATEERELSVRVTNEASHA